MNEFAGKTYGAALAHLAQRHGDRTALVFQGRTWSFAEVKAEVDRCAARLGTLGVAPQDKVALWMSNRPDFIWYWLAIGQVGLVAVLLNTRLTAEEITFQLRQSETRAIIVPGRDLHRNFLGDLLALCPQLEWSPPGGIGATELPDLRHVICLDPPASRAAGLTDWSAPAVGTGAPANETDPSRPTMIVYSSGSTALPKGVMLTHAVWRKAYDHGPYFGQTPDDCLYLCVPLFGIMANVNGILTMWSHGSCVVLEDGFDAGAALRDMAAYRCSVVYLLPVMLDRLLNHPERATFDLGRLRTGTVITKDPHILRQAIEELGLRELYATYGMSETSSVILRSRSTDSLEVRLNSHGKPLPDIEVRIADPDIGQAVADGAMGEIQVRGYSIMAGYYNNPDATRAAFTQDGWFRTRDAGFRRPDGNIRFVERLSDGYKHNGFNVSSIEIEGALMRHPAVAEAAVTGIPERISGEQGIAFVVLRQPGTADEADLAAYLRPLLSSYKRPSRIFIVPDLPVTAGTGKVQKFRLKQIAQERLAAGFSGR
jgi:fatty-acyl-CoA synthase